MKIYTVNVEDFGTVIITADYNEAVEEFKKWDFAILSWF